MDVTINRAECLDAARRAASVAPSKSPLDALKGALLEADADTGKLTITSTNLDVALEEKLPCTVREGGSFAFSAKLLAEILQRLPLETVTITRPNNCGRAVFQSECACYTMDVWERGAFPKPELPFPEDTVKLSGVPTMAKHTVFATSQDSSKPLLKCVNLMFTQNGLKAAGSNGNCIVTAKGDHQSTGDINLLIPATSLDKLAGICTDADEFRVGTTGQSIVFLKENFLFSARLMGGSYIDTEMLIRSIQNSFTVLTSVQEMRNALSVVQSVAPEASKVTLAFGDQAMEFRCEGCYGSASAPLGIIALTGVPAGEYCFNARQLNTCLKAMTGTVTLGIARSGMLTLSTQDAYYIQNALRPMDLSTKKEKPSEKAA